MAGLSAALIAPVMSFAAVSAAAVVEVTPSAIGDWATASTTSGGTVNFVSDASSPLPDGALQLTTDTTTASKAQYMHPTATAVASITDLGYSSKQNSASFAGGNASYQLPMFLNGTEGFTTLVYEPYQNGTVTPGEWQNWDVDAGQFWSTRSVTCSNGSVAAGGGGTPFYTLDQIATLCPEAVAFGFGVNVGSNNPSYDISVDGVVFNETTYDFQLDPITLGSKEECKNGGWETSEAPVFKNQGDCVSSFASEGRAKGNPIANLFRNLF